MLPVARALVPSRAAAALVTLGPEGAVLVTADGAWQATPPRIRVVSTVGAGDSSLAGYLLADVAGDGPADRLLQLRPVRRGRGISARHAAPTPHDLPAGDILVRTLSASGQRAVPSPDPVQPP